MRPRLMASALASALLYHLALPGGLWPWLGWLALLPLLWALDHDDMDGHLAARWLGWPLGLAFGLLQFRWMFNMVPAAEMTVSWIMVPGALIWIAYVSLYFWAFARLMGALRGRLGPAALWIAPLAWTLLEWLRGSGVFAFSWVHLSQSQAQGGYLAPAAWVGGLGLSFLMVFFQAALLRSLSRRPRLRRQGLLLLGACAILLALAALPSQGPATRTLRAAALQGNIALEDKWRADYRDENLRIFAEMSAAAAGEGARLALWPETAYPVNLLYRRRCEESLRLAAREAGLWVFTGFQGLQPRGEGYAYRNSAGLLSPSGALEGVYGKVRLLPFGEYIPLPSWLLPGVEIDLGQADFQPGGGERVFLADGVPLAPFICYEMGFAGDASRSVRRGARLLVNPTNDGWFEHPLALELHAALSPMRAAENGVPVLRCGNSGITLWADARGRVMDRLPAGERGTLLADIPIGEGSSFYARTGAWLPPLLGILYLLGWLLTLARGGAQGESRPRESRRAS